MKAALVRDREEIPLLEDLLTAWPDVRINIDPKHDAAVDPLVDLIERTGHDRPCVHRRVLRPPPGPRSAPASGRGCAPRWARARSARLLAAARGLPAGAFSAACVQVPVKQGPVPLVTDRFVAAAHERGLQVHVWTINDADEMRPLLDLGVDGIMTDRADVLKAVLGEREPSGST